MTTTAALLTCVLLLGSSTVPHQDLKKEPADPMPTRASRAALIVDTSSIDTTVVLLPPQPTCDRVKAWAEQVRQLLVSTGRSEDAVVIKVAEKEHREIAQELRRRIARLLDG